MMSIETDQINFATQKNYTFDTSRACQDFLQHFDITDDNVQTGSLQGNPFLGSKVEFSQIPFKNWIPQEDKSYINDIVEILTKYGSQISYVSLDFHIHVGENLQNFYSQLRDFLQLMPNLKKLCLSFTQCDGISRYFEKSRTKSEIWRLVPRGSISLHFVFQGGIEQVFSQNLLPLLPNLQCFETKNVPSVLFNEIVKKSINIARLLVQREDYHTGYNIILANFANLTELSLQFGSDEHLEQFESCSLPVNLKKFSFLYGESFSFVPWSRIILALENKLSESCEELILQLPMPTDNEQVEQVLMDSHSCRLNLQNLRKVTIFDDKAFCLDFLLPCKLLDSISLRVSNVSEENSFSMHFKKQEERFAEFGKSQIIQFVGYKDKMEESDIWGKFPKLNEFAIHGKKEMGGTIMYRRQGSNGCTVDKYIE